MHYIDHIVIGIHDLEKGIASIEDLTGVKPVYGGAHPSLGTHNALISLGNRTYLEILAPNPDAFMNWLSWLTDFRAMYLRKMLFRIDNLKPFLWAVGSYDLHTTAAHMSDIDLTVSKPKAGRRKKPNGELLNWQTVSFAQGMTTELPFFIRWDNLVNSPAKNSPKGCKLTQLSVYTRNLTDLKNIVRKLNIPINIQEAKKTSLVIELKCPKGRVKIG
ncbi:MAG: VOC family protein [Candidatus Marinimicrobia bacterium]|jgi:hypothetical protein|nr:VOC family protein [Candidatus Neomarinimicrobiota bacterium]|tara:strand:- start:13167 stop:13817 length:651 start_codon:yes stop_codon:yes gene_type:complete